MKEVANVVDVKTGAELSASGMVACGDFVLELLDARDRRREGDSKKLAEALTEELSQIAERTIRVRPRECPEVKGPDEDVKAEGRFQPTNVTQRMVEDYNYILEHGERLRGDLGVAIKLLQESWRVQYPRGGMFRAPPAGAVLVTEKLLCDLEDDRVELTMVQVELAALRAVVDAARALRADMPHSLHYEWFVKHGLASLDKALEVLDELV